MLHLHELRLIGVTFRNYQYCCDVNPFDIMAIGSATQAEVGKSDPIVTRLSQEDKTAWYRKPNLRFLYFMLFPTCMGIEMTSGFDSQMINALQIVPYWKTCEFQPCSCHGKYADRPVKTLVARTKY